MHSLRSQSPPSGRTVAGFGTAAVLLLSLALVDLAGAGGFVAGSSSTHGVGSGPRAITTGDFNEDGRPDILLQLFSVGDGIAYFENTGNGQFANPVNIGGGVLGGGPHLARDWDGDGHTDIVGLTGPAMNLYRGDGKGNFTAATPAAYSTSSNIFLIGDLNGDELDDVVAMVAGATSLLSLLSVVDPERSVTAIDPSDFEMSTIDGARHALDAGRRLTDRVARGAAEIGASMSRLETAVTATSTMRDNEIEAASRIMDVDVAEESAALGASRILQQASVAVLAQANAAPELVLRLLNVD